jgi:hypothetical protein
LKFDCALTRQIEIFDVGVGLGAKEGPVACQANVFLLQSCITDDLHQSLLVIPPWWVNGCRKNDPLAQIARKITKHNMESFTNVHPFVVSNTSRRPGTQKRGVRPFSKLREENNWVDRSKPQKKAAKVP